MVASQFSVVESQIQLESRHITVLNIARKIEAASREDRKEENKKPARKSSEIPTRRGDTARACRISRPHPLSPRTSSVSLSFLVPSSPHFFIVLSCRDLPVRKPPLGVSLMRQYDTRVVVYACIRTRSSSVLSQNVFLPAT